MIQSLRTTTSSLAICRALPEVQLSVAEPVGFGDVFEPCHRHYHRPVEAPPFNLLEHISKIPTRCYYCDGSGKCQNDYPRPGSGKDWKGEDEYRCSGSGKCDHCGGSGWLFQRTTVTMH